MSSGGTALGMGTRAGNGPGSGRAGEKPRVSQATVSPAVAHAKGRFFMSSSSLPGVDVATLFLLAGREFDSARKRKKRKREYRPVWDQPLV
jgi:hypothetical protein